VAGSDVIWTEETIDKLFDLGPDHYLPGTKMPMQRIARPGDRADLIEFLQTRTQR
jgi:cytochrome c